MNIQVQCCGIAILILLLYFSLRHKQIGLFTEKLFICMLFGTFLCVALDITSVFAIVYHSSLPEPLVLFFCKAYVISLVWVGFLGFIYAIVDLHSGRQYMRIFMRNCFVVIVGSVFIAVLPIHYYVDESSVYSYGPSTLLTYLFAVGYVALTLYMVIVHRKSLSHKRRRAVMIWMIVWIIAAGIQFLNSKLLLVGFASTVGMMILFFELENPEARIDRQTGVFNSHAMQEYMAQLYRRDISFCLLVISLEGYQRDVKNLKDVEQAIPEIVKYLESFTKAKIFKSVGQEMYLVFEEQKELFSAFSDIAQRFQKYWNYGDDANELLLDPLFVVLPDSSVATGADELISLLKTFLHEANQNPEGSTVCYADVRMVEERREKERMQGTILSAIQEDRVVVFFQPIYSTHKKKFTSAEALVRIINPDGTYLPPGRFIPVAEETGLVSKLGEIVFEKTCRFMKQNKLWELGVEYIEVNLSIRQCEDRSLAYRYMNIIQENDLKPEYINLEITETASIRAKNALLDNMNLLIDEGVHFSLDDFGSGESNLNYIVDMPVSIVKFDRDMSQAYFENKRAKFVMEAAMRMIHDMHLKIVSEGVETKEQMETIVGIGIDYIQGYYFSKPLPEQEYLAFIMRENCGAEG